MKKLILIRHAKSSWEFQLNDIDRPLNSVGVEKANKISINTKHLVPPNPTIFSSNAKRALSTCAIFVKNWDLDLNKIKIVNNLYTFDCFEFEKTIKNTNNSVDELIIFGHNPALTDFVNKFGNIYINNVPTSGFVSIIFDTNNWIDIKKGKTVNAIFPKDL